MSEALKPCPFCGSSFVEISRYGNSKVSTCYYCNDCGAGLETGETSNHGSGWNERFESPMQKAAPEMYEMLSALLPQLAGSPAALKINRILAKARGEL